MSLESILRRIREDTEKEAEAIRAEASEESRIAEERHREAVERSFEREHERLEARTRDSRDRKEFHVRMEASRQIRNARRSRVDSAIEKAVASMTSLEDGAYLELIESLLGDCGFVGEVEVRISPKDEKRITRSWLKERSRSGVKFVLSEERHTGTGGIILRSGRISQNATFSTIADLAHEEMVMKLASAIPLEGED